MDSQRVEEEEVLSASQYDVQTEEEWTIISSADTSEDHSQETSDILDIIGIGNDNETNEVRTNEENMTGKGKVKESGSDISNENESKSQNEKKVMDENNDNENKENLNTDNIQELKEAKLRVKDDETLSDIDIIEDETSADDEEEDDLSESASMCSSSVISQMSSLSFLSDPYLRAKLNPDYIPEDVSDISSLVYRRHDGDEDVRAVLELKPGVRAYVHTPNTQLNVRLNLLLALAVTAVLGLGVGNFLGWSTHKNSKQLSLSQVMNLKQLQDELIDCMDHQTPSFKHNGVRNTNNVCYGNSVYWKEKFEKLFSENGGLMELLEKTQKHYHLKGNHDNILSDKDCVNATASEEFHNLKLGMLVKQMEHLHLLKTLEEIKLKQEQSTKRVNVLETENSELKMKLIEEEEDDKQMEESWGSKVAELEDENEKLRVRLVEEDIEDEKDAIMMNELQGTIGELQEENMELKGALGQLEAQIERAGHHHHSNMKDLNKVDYSVRPSSETNTYNSVPVKLDQLRQRIN